MVDQFEEIFRYRRQAENSNDADAFVNLLLASTTVTDRSTPIYVVITMRSDFIGDCAVFAGLPERISESQFLTPRLTRSQYRAAIEEPARLFEGELAPELVNQLLNDISTDPDQLPVLQHALMRMWLRAGGGPGRRLTLGDYEAVGGLAGALSQHADEALRELNRSQQSLAKRLFQCLCERSAEGRDTRRPARLSEVAAVAGVEVEAVKPVVEAFRRPDRCFLTPSVSVALTADTVLDISHESLIRQWQQLDTWVQEETESAVIYQRLEDAARRRREGKAALWREPDLTIGLQWRDSEHPSPAWAARYGGDFNQAVAFLEESQREREQELQEEEAARQRELDMLREREEFQRTRAEEQAQSARRLRNRALWAMAAMVVAVLFAALASLKWDEATTAKKEAVDAQRSAEQSAADAMRAAAEAEAQRKIALTTLVQFMVAQSTANRDRWPQRSLLLGIEALKLAVHTSLADTTSANLKKMAEDSLQNALAVIGGIPLHGHEDSVSAVAFSPDGRTLASGSWDKTVRLRDLANPAVEPRILHHEDSVWAMAFSPDGRTLASASGDGTVRLWDLANPAAESRILPSHEAPVTAVAFSPDGCTLASGSRDKTVRLWDLANPAAEPRILRGHENYVFAIAFSPDGRLLASGSADKTVRLWDLANLAAEPRILRGHTDAVSALAFSPDGRLLASGSADRTVRIWHPDDTLIDLTCRTAGRNLSQEEWQRYRGDEPYHKTCKNLPIHPSLVYAGDELAKAGDISGAVAQYRKVLEIEPGLTFDPEAKAKQSAARGSVEKGKELAKEGKINEALAAFSQARQYDPSLEITADSWNKLCWNGSLWRQAAAVMHACEQAVKLSPDDSGIRDSRGIAKALTGDLTGASEDFRAYLEWAPTHKRPEAEISKRQHWLQELEAGRNPFDAATLEALRKGEM